MEALNLTPEQRTALVELLGTKDMDFLRGMLSLVYDPAIQAAKATANAKFVARGIANRIPFFWRQAKSEARERSKRSNN